MESVPKTKVESKARRAIEKHKNSHYLLLLLALLGSCMVIADGVLTPAMSVFSASSALERSISKLSTQLSSLSPKHQDSLTAHLSKYVPLTSACAILIGLFALQHYGTHKIGFIFAPIISLWLLFIGSVGAYNIFHWNRQVFCALSPGYMYRFFKDADINRWKSLGGVLLCIAGSEAMFADLGHFSKKSVKISFCFLVYPSLVLCYMGQTAYMSANYHGESVHFLGASMPGSAHHVFTALALFATAVGSQAAITGIFSIISQCLALGCFPRVKVVHTSDKIHGQVYIPDINWILLLLCLSITIGFRDIGHIGNAAGLAIITGMLATTCLMSLIISLYWEKNILISALFLIFFGAIEATYFSACVLNLHEGAWFLIFFVVVLLVVMLTWHYGTMKKYEFELHNRVCMEWLTDLGPSLGVARVPGIGFIYTDLVRGIPAFFSHFVTNLPAFHQVLIFVSFKSVPIPYVKPSRRFLIGRFGTKEYRVYRCIVRYGYCDSIGDKDNFEDQLIRRIGEFISVEDIDPEAFTFSEGRMVVIGNLQEGSNAFIPHVDSEVGQSSTLASSELTKTELGSQLPSITSPARKKRIRFLLPPESPQMRPSVREELQEIVDARDYGTAYFLGKTHLSARKGANFLKKIILGTYIFLDKNCREPSVALNIPLAALVEVGMVYII
ncbi:potassium transporter 6-like isoform X2 [Aristolochia californica]